MLSSSSSISFSHLSITRSAILAAMGYSDFEPERTILDKIDYLLSYAETHSNPSFCYELYTGSCQKDALQIDDVSFLTGRIILHSLKGSTRFAVFTATAGNLFQQWMEEMDRSEDMVDRYIADCIGTEIAEATANLMQNQLAEECLKEALGITNRYSPGYCGWNISGQHQLFSLFDDKEPCGIRLMDSGLMYPIKSVSGIIGIGKDVTLKDYGCSQCHYPKCFRRKR